MTSQQDIDHVTAAYGLLAPGGILVTIMSAGVLFRENKKTVDVQIDSSKFKRGDHVKVTIEDIPD